MAIEKTVFVTGASGFIAKHIVLQLLQAGHRVRGSVRSQAKAEEVRRAVKANSNSGEDYADRLKLVELNLNADAGWEDALQGVDALLHTASPFPLAEPKDENDLIRPAVDGTLRALRAAENAGVNRVVLTSSFAAIGYGDPPPDPVVWSPDNWTDLNSPRVTAYVKSKTLAEQAAWDFVKDHPKMKLTTINPTLVLGPALDTQIGSSLELLQRIMNRGDPAVPNLKLGVVDVRDIAAMHVAALQKPKSAGRRFLGASAALWFVDVAKVLQTALPQRKYVTRVAPNWFLRLFAIFDSSVKGILPSLGEDYTFDATATQDILGVKFIAHEKTIVDAAKFLIENQLVKPG